MALLPAVSSCHSPDGSREEREKSALLFQVKSLMAEILFSICLHYTVYIFLKWSL